MNANIRIALTALLVLGSTVFASAQTAQKTTLTLEGAKKVIAGAVAYAKKNNAPGGVIAVVDDGGNLMALERLDGTFAAGAKAYWDDTNNRLGILDATPAAAFTVGSGDRFQVSSIGAISTTIAAAANAVGLTVTQNDITNNPRGVSLVNAGTGNKDPGFGAVRVGQPTTTAVTFFERDRKTGYAQQFNLGVQQELPGRMVLELAYIGNVSRNLPGPNLSINQIPPEALRPGVTQRDRPFPQFSNVSIVLPTIGRDTGGLRAAFEHPR